MTRIFHNTQITSFPVNQITLPPLTPPWCTNSNRLILHGRVFPVQNLLVCSPGIKGEEEAIIKPLSGRDFATTLYYELTNTACLQVPGLLSLGRGSVAGAAGREDRDGAEVP